MYVGNLTAGLVTDDMLRQLFNSTMAAAFPDMAQPGAGAGAAGARSGGSAGPTSVMIWLSDQCGVLASHPICVPLSCLVQTGMECSISSQPRPPPAGYDPVVNVNVHTDGRYAFVELRTPDMATASLQLNGQVGAAAAVCCGVMPAARREAKCSHLII